MTAVDAASWINDALDMRARWMTVCTALALFVPVTARGQGADAAKGAEPPEDAATKDARDEPQDGTDKPDEGETDKPPEGETASDVVELPADAADDDRDLEQYAEDDAGPPAPGALTPDFDQPQPPGIERLEHHHHRWMWQNLTAVRVNPLGLTNRFYTGYQMQLSHRDEPIFEESYGAIQLDTEITPAFGTVGGRLEIQPVKLFNFWASYGLVGSFGSSGYTRSFDSAAAEYDDELLDDTSDTEDYASVGQRATAAGLFQVGIAGLVMRSNVKAHWTKLDLRDGDNVFWDATLDVLVPNDGWVITNDADLLVVTDWDLIIGLRHTVTHALYRDEQLLGAKNINTPHHRVGPALIYTFFEDEPGAIWNKPQLVLLAQWWAKHRYRTSDSPGMPYLVLAFAQQGDFMISDKK